MKDVTDNPGAFFSEGQNAWDNVRCKEKFWNLQWEYFKWNVSFWAWDGERQENDNSWFFVIDQLSEWADNNTYSMASKIEILQINLHSPCKNNENKKF